MSDSEDEQMPTRGGRKALAKAAAIADDGDDELEDMFVDDEVGGSGGGSAPKRLGRL